MEKDRTKNKLPEGWIWATIGEIGIVQSGGTPSTRNKEFWGDEISWITPADLSGYNSKYISKGNRNITQIGLEYSSAKLLPKGSILFSSRAPIGYTVIAKNELATNQGFKNLIPTKSLNSEYVYYYFKTLKSKAEEVASGTTFLELSATKFSLLPFPLPPLKEQERIVSKIESLFSVLDQAEKGLQKAKQQLNVYSQALLKNAFDGRLTNRWRETNKGTSYKWKVLSINNFCRVKGGKRLPKRTEYSDYKTKHPYLRVTDFNNYTVIRENLKYINEEVFEKISNYIISKEDVYLSIAGTIGLSGVVPESLDNANLTENAAKLIISDKVDKYFLAYALSSPSMQIQIAEKTKSTSQPKLALYNIRSLSLEVPDIDEQKQIVQELESQFSLINNLERSILRSLNDVIVLKQAILKKALDGKLVERDSNDKHASELLVKIKLEKEKYLAEQEELRKNKPKKIKKMSKSLSIEEVLKTSDKPILAKTVWLESKHNEDIAEFYAELKELGDKVVELKEGLNSLLSLKK